jgi:hypothetical protein
MAKVWRGNPRIDWTVWKRRAPNKHSRKIRNDQLLQRMPTVRPTEQFLSKILRGLLYPPLAFVRGAAGPPFLEDLRAVDPRFFCAEICMKLIGSNPAADYSYGERLSLTRFLYMVYL